MQPRVSFVENSVLVSRKEFSAYSPFATCEEVVRVLTGNFEGDSKSELSYKKIDAKVEDGEEVGEQIFRTTIVKPERELVAPSQEHHLPKLPPLRSILN